MKLPLAIGLLEVFAFKIIDAQHALPPGVPPQQYQQPPPPPQQQQHHQQPQYHQPQQVPVAPQQVHAAHVQQPQAHQPTVHLQYGNDQLLNTANLAHEKEHIQEHMDVPIDTSKMSEQELQFHYFKMHDADNNNKLDGCELIKSLIHWHDGSDVKSVIRSDEQLKGVIDPLLELMDLNKDGFLDYTEFRQSNH